MLSQEDRKNKVTVTHAAHCDGFRRGAINDMHFLVVSAQDSWGVRYVQRRLPFIFLKGDLKLYTHDHVAKQINPMTTQSLHLHATVQ